VSLAPTLVWEVDEENQLSPFLIEANEDRRRVTWAPQPGSQEAFLECPVFEVLYEGTRGPGKTDALLMDFAQHVGQGWGAEWKGILFRRTYPELEDVIQKSLKWFPLLFPKARFTSSPNPEWTFPDGEKLYFRNIKNVDGYWDYHGHAYPWIAWEELTTWPDDKCYLMMMSVCRSTTPGMPRKYRSTTNPFGRGHNWVRSRFHLPIERGKVVGRVIRETDEDGGTNERVAIHGYLEENRVLLHADPGYKSRLRQSATSESMERAWLHGDWDIIAGGMFDDIWDKGVHFITPFPIPDTWIIDRAFDWGSSRPFSVGWYAQSDGCDVPGFGPTRRGDVFRIAEWYGWTGNVDEGCRMTASQVAEGIREREKRIFGERKIRPGPADSQIWATDQDESVAQIMAKFGVYWVRASKGPGTRELGWQRIRDMLRVAKQGSREEPGFFVFDCCEQFFRTVPSLSRDSRKIDDVDTESEDHVGDEVRYRLFTRPSRMGVKPFQGR
jgi:hypothetical protein